MKLTTKEISEARFRRFMRELSDFERKVAYEMLLDDFLDVVSKFEKSPSKEGKVLIVQLAFQLHDLNPEFVFERTFAD